MTDYAGDVDASAAWKRLADEPDSLLVDVRTGAEWAFVGVPDLSALNKTVILEEWQRYPNMDVNPDFAQRVHEAVKEYGGSQATEIYFLCRSGVRSKSAASALTSLGYSRCFNVTGGFEGPPDEQKHRGSIDGWKAKALPWTQK